MGFILSLIPLFSAVESAGGISMALSSITITQWITIGIQALAAGPEAKAFLAKLHPALTVFMADLEKNRDPGAAAKAVDFWYANQPPTISGYDGSGAIVQIPNPDYRG